MFYTADGAQLFYTILGSGPDLVLLHPTPVDHRFWLPAAQILAHRYRVILPDLRGHGQSEAGEGPGTPPITPPIIMERLGADLERLLNELNIGRALFGGCSIGGYTLYELWRRMPDRAAALAFCCSKPQPDSDANRTKRQETIGSIRLRGTGDFIETMLGTVIGPTAHRRWPQKIAEAREMMQTMRNDAAIAIQQGLASRPDSVATAKTLRVPCCVLAGGEDGSSTPAEMRLLAETIRNTGYFAEYHEIPDAGHYAPWEQPAS